MQEDDERTQDVSLSSSVEEWNQAREYEKNYENGIKDSLKEKRSRSRFESIDVIAAMGKSRMNRGMDRKTEKEARKDDAIAQDKSKSARSVALNKVRR